MKEQGAALVMSLLVIICLSGLALGMVAASSAERQIAGNARGAAATGLAADAVIEGVIAEVAAAPDWSALLSGARTSAFQDATRRPITPARAIVDLDQVAAEVQSETSSTFPLGAGTPVWRLFAWGPLTRLAGLPSSESGAYVAAWVADDPADGDLMADIDTNGTIMVHSEAFGYGGTRRASDAVLGRAPFGVRVLSWRNR